MKTPLQLKPKSQFVPKKQKSSSKPESQSESQSIPKSKASKPKSSLKSPLQPKPKASGKPHVNFLLGEDYIHTTSSVQEENENKLSDLEQKNTCYHGVYACYFCSMGTCYFGASHQDNKGDFFCHDPKCIKAYSTKRKELKKFRNSKTMCIIQMDVNKNWNILHTANKKMYKNRSKKPNSINRCPIDPSVIYNLE